MRGAVHGQQMRVVDAGIDLRGGQAGVAQQLLDGAQIAPAASRCVAKLWRSAWGGGFGSPSDAAAGPWPPPPLPGSAARPARPGTAAHPPPAARGRAADIPPPHRGPQAAPARSVPARPCRGSAAIRPAASRRRPAPAPRRCAAPARKAASAPPHHGRRPKAWGAAPRPDPARRGPVRGRSGAAGCEGSAGCGWTAPGWRQSPRGRSASAGTTAPPTAAGPGCAPTGRAGVPRRQSRAGRSG